MEFLQQLERNTKSYFWRISFNGDRVIKPYPRSLAAARYIAQTAPSDKLEALNLSYLLASNRPFFASCLESKRTNKHGCIHPAVVQHPTAIGKTCPCKKMRPRLSHRKPPFQASMVPLISSLFVLKSHSRQQQQFQSQASKWSITARRQLASVNCSSTSLLMTALSSHSCRNTFLFLFYSFSLEIDSLQFAFSSAYFFATLPVLDLQQQQKRKGPLRSARFMPDAANEICAPREFDVSSRLHCAVKYALRKGKGRLCTYFALIRASPDAPLARSVHVHPSICRSICLDCRPSNTDKY